MAKIVWCFISSRYTDVEDVGPKTSPTTGPCGLFGSWVSEGSRGLVVAVTSSLRPGTKDKPPGALSTEDLVEDCLVSLVFDKYFWVLKTIVAFALPIKYFCDT